MAPFAWYDHITRMLVQELGYHQSKADPCIFQLYDDKNNLIGIIGLATDDMLHGGNEIHQQKMESLRKTYTLGNFNMGRGDLLEKT